MNSAILRYLQPANRTAIQYADDLSSNMCKLTEIYNKSILYATFTARVSSSTYHSLREHGASHLNTDMTDTIFKAQSQLEIYDGFVNSRLLVNHAAP